MPLGPQLRRLRLRRSPLAFWVAAVAVASFTGLTVSHLVGEAAARAARLGGLITVPVAARPVEAGSTLAAADVALRRLPAAAVPSGRLAGAALGRTALVPLAAGEVLLAAKLAPERAQGVAALLSPGSRALAVPVETGGLPLERGHRVDVLATFDTEPQHVADAGAATGPPTFPVATAALVVDVAEAAVTVAVSRTEAPRVAFALARGTVTLALVGN